MANIQKVNSLELQYLSELMQDFPVAGSPPADECLRIIMFRHSEFSPEALSKILRQILKQRSNAQFQKHLADLPCNLHQNLYKGILSNAGSYRQQTDPANGIVRFGNNAKHHGTSCEKIEQALKQALTLLSLDDQHPIYNGLKFYQQLLMIHPFYDANGRIGRFILSLYLDMHGYYIYWDRVNKNSKWLKKLSACHVRYGGDPQKYELYVQRLVDHFTQFIISKNEIDDT